MNSKRIKIRKEKKGLGGKAKWKKQKKKGREYKMNQSNITHMTQNQEVQEYVFIMMAVSDLGVTSAITIYFL